MIVSIIIPTFNRIKLLPLALESISLTDGIEKEIIIIDDGSTDGTQALITEMYPHVLFISQNQQGAPASRNLGLVKAKGKFIIFLDSDDLLEGGFIQSKLDSFKSKSHLDGIYGSWDFFKSEDVFHEDKIIPRFSEYPIYGEGQESEIMGNLLGGWFIPISAVMWKKSFLEKLGGFRMDLLINQDVDLMFRAIVKNGKICGETSPKTWIREHSNERVGVIKHDSDKINQLYKLRRFFKEELERAGKWNEKYAMALSEYLFEMWALYRKDRPVEAKNFLDFCIFLNPKIEVKGGFFYKMLGKILGSHRAVIIKQTVKF